DLPPGLLALRHDIATAEHSITANRWLTKQPAAAVLADLAAGRMPLTHQALDQLPKRQVLEHLRLTLVAVGALPSPEHSASASTPLCAGNKSPPETGPATPPTSASAHPPRLNHWTPRYSGTETCPMPHNEPAAVELQRDPLPLHGRVAVVTGVSRHKGIGYA